MYRNNIFNTLNTNVKLNNNQKAKDFLYIIPLTININDLNNNEKYYNLRKNLTVKTKNICNIKTWDFMLYGNNCIVIFYEIFKTSYSYTRIGYIENANELREILEKESIEITFSINKKKN
nr:cyclophilin-like fold protein [Brachyspira sp.]